MPVGNCDGAVSSATHRDPIITHRSLTAMPGRTVYARTLLKHTGRGKYIKYMRTQRPIRVKAIMVTAAMRAHENTHTYARIGKVEPVETVMRYDLCSSALVGVLYMYLYATRPYACVRLRLVTSAWHCSKLSNQVQRLSRRRQRTGAETTLIGRKVDVFARLGNFCFIIR